MPANRLQVAGWKGFKESDKFFEMGEGLERCNNRRINNFEFGGDGFFFKLRFTGKVRN